MTKFNREQIINAARQLLTDKPGGMQFSDLKRAIIELAPDTPSNSVSGGLVAWVNRDEEIVKPSPGLFVLKNLIGTVESEATSAVAPSNPLPSKILESDLYQPFAEWLIEEGEVSDARALGGSSLQAKWGTPDVIGVTKPQPNDPVKFAHEIVAVEMKSDSSSAIVAFGQACAYRLFAHRVYIVMPATISQADKSRLQALCSLYGIGFVLWERPAKDTTFSVVERARNRQPDMYYANEFARRIQVTDVKVFNALF